MSGALVLHAGAREVSRDELNTIEVPPATETWFPLKHGHVLDTVEATLEGAGFRVEKRRLALSGSNARFFGTLDLSTPVAKGINLAVGVRNSTDKTFPLGFCAGSRCFVCDNLAFRSDLLVTKKHTKFGSVRFEENIASAVQGLHQFRDAEAQQIAIFQGAQLSEDAANSYLLQAFEQKLVGHRLLAHVIRKWRNPRFEEFAPRTRYSLLNAFTSALSVQRDKQPTHYAAVTMRLQRFLSPKE